MIYLDSAATSFLKPDCVHKAVMTAMQTMSSVGRGEHSAAMTASAACYNCRCLLGDMFDCEPEQVVFTKNATEAINIAVNSLVERGDRVVISGYEHNAVTRPLFATDAKISVAKADLFDDEELLRQFEILLPRAKACVCTHVSNVFGYVLPIAQIAKLCEKYSVPLIIDASQSAGVIPLSMRETKASFIAMAGHKSLLGPQGTGVLLCNAKTKPIICGGTGSDSIRQSMPIDLPERLEAGTMNIWGIAGLSAGLGYINDRGMQNIAEHENMLKNALISELVGFDNIEIFSDNSDKKQLSVLSVRFFDHDCNTLADKLAKADVATRAGLHCAPLAHKTVGTLGTGTLRFSFSALGTLDEITWSAQILRDILNKS